MGWLPGEPRIQRTADEKNDRNVSRGNWLHTKHTFASPSEKPKTPRKERLARRKTSMRLNDTEKEATPFTANAQPPAARSTRVAQELAAGKRNGGRPSPGWVGPRRKTKNDGQPEITNTTNYEHKLRTHNYERYCALRMSWPPMRHRISRRHLETPYLL